MVVSNSNNLFEYGFCTLLYVIEEHEKNGNYEECQIILNVILRNCKKLDMEVPTRYGSEALSILKSKFMESGTTGEIAVKNIYLGH